MQCRARRAIAAAILVVGFSCTPSERIEPEVSAAKSEAPRIAAQPAVTPRSAPADTASLPVVGDPLGLLSKKPKAGEVIAAGKRDPSVLDPGSLANPSAKANAVAAPERDPRAVARAASTVIDRSAPTAIREVTMADIRNAVLARPQPHVLFLYGSYCPACRDAMPKFVEAVRAYGGPAGITAVSIEEDRDALAAYVPALGGVIEPLLLTGRGLRKATEEMGVVWAGTDSVQIPKLAVFDARGRLVRQGGSSEVARLAKTLREL